MGAVEAVRADDRAATVAALRRQIAAVPSGPQRSPRTPPPAGSGPVVRRSKVSRVVERQEVADPALVPLPESLRELVPGGGLAAGQTVACSGGQGLLVSVLAAATAAGRRCAVVGYPQLGLAAVAAEGGDLSRLACVPAAGADPGAVASVLLDGMDLVLLDPACGRIAPARARVLAGRARTGGAVLLVGAEDWPNADLRLEAAPARATGLDRGYGRITVLSFPVRARGKGFGVDSAPVAELHRFGVPSRSVAGLPARPSFAWTGGGETTQVDVVALGARRAG